MRIPSREVSGVNVGVIGYGSMNLTWKPTQTPDEQAMQCLIDSIEQGSNMINAGEFYGVPPHQSANLELMSRFFAKHPEYADQVFLSVKGGIDLSKFAPDSSEQGLRKSITNINNLLTSQGGKKKMDLFECARVDKTIPIEETMATLIKLRDEGHFKYIGLSEVSAQTIRRAAAIAPIAAVEVEYSLAALDIESNGVLDACKELNIPIVAYSPIARGLLSGSITSEEHIPEGDHRRHYDKFVGDNLKQNLKLVESVKAFAQQKKATPTQIAIAWLLHQSPLIIPIPGSTRPEGVAEALGATQINLSDAELEQIRGILDENPVKGKRYAEAHEAMLEG
ncbi:hypothetical protein OIO90_002644 [Microbotryomycetes sp. JL221]|nr:hypothetical protein OIO90_002644 [Microbotryomycetes sp. JL221]